MRNESLPLKVGLLMILAVALVSAAGYLTYKSLSRIVASIEVKSRPDLRLITIRDIAADLDKAESSVRMYRLTQNQEDIKPYYSVIGRIDDKIDTLRAGSINDTTLMPQIDTISNLIEENMLVWNEMIDLHHTDSLDIFIRQLVAKIAVGTLNEKSTERSILKRVFSRKALKEEEAQAREAARRKIIRDLNEIELRKSLKDSLMLKKESQMSATGNEIRERLYMVIARMENEVIESVKANSQTADRLAVKTYKWLALFAIVATLLIIAVLLVVVRFVRKTREYQEALENSRRETEKLAKTKELFVANMSHEIRTPVNAINGFSEQLLHESLPDGSRKMLEVIRSASGHLVQIVNDILDYSRLENAKIELEKTHFRPYELLEELKLLFLNNASSNNTLLNTEVSENTPSVLFGDSHRLKQILLNLTGNAIKFTRNGSVKISIDALDFLGDDFNLMITVQDSGIGISPEMQNRVFEEFTQAEAGTSRKYGGTGLGLSIVKKLVDLHHGKISLESEKGKGTMITCILPYKKGAANSIIKIPDVLVIPDSLKGLKVMIVDDENYNRLLFTTIFRRWKLSFDEAGDGKTAVEKIKSGNYDMVFMDARMPGMDGLEAALFVRNNLGISADQLPIIGTSATHSSEDMSMYLSSGMNAFLAKPFTEKMLISVMLSVKRPGYMPQNEPELISGKDGETDTLNLDNLYHLANNDVLFVKQLLYSFIESTEKGMTGLEEAVRTNDLQSVYEIAHKISAPCKHVGANLLYSQLKIIEQQAKNHENMDKLVKLSDESAREFNAVKQGLQKHLEKI